MLITITNDPQKLQDLLTYWRKLPGEKRHKSFATFPSQQHSPTFL